jgi:hypothetical protein
MNLLEKRGKLVLHSIKTSIISVDEQSCCFRSDSVDEQSCCFRSDKFRYFCQSNCVFETVFQSEICNSKLEIGLGSVVQWIVFQIPILKMQVRFLPGLRLLTLYHREK